MWELEKVSQVITEGPIFEELEQDRKAEIASIPRQDLLETVKVCLSRPEPLQIGGMAYFRILRNLVLAAQYYEMFSDWSTTHHTWRA